MTWLQWIDRMNLDGNVHSRNKFFPIGFILRMWQDPCEVMKEVQLCVILLFFLWF